MYDCRDAASFEKPWYKRYDKKHMTVTVNLYYENDDGEEVEEEYDFPMKFEVCGLCNGKGSHVNPSIDSHGISAEEWDRDWSYEDRETYMSGGYDVSCYECDGQRVVPELLKKNISVMRAKRC